MSSSGDYGTTRRRTQAVLLSSNSYGASAQAEEGRSWGRPIP